MTTGFEVRSLRDTMARSIFVLLACLAAAGCGKREAPRLPRVSVTVATAEQRDMPISLRATGTVESIQSASVGSQVGGMVTRIAFREGDDVRAGQALIELDARPFRASLQQATAQLARDRAQANAARVEAERSALLFRQQALSQSEWDARRATADALAATVQADSANVARARLDLEFSTIRSPVTGRTGDVKVHVGDYVKAATSEPLVVVNQVRPILVRFAVPQEDAAGLLRRPGQALRVFARLAPGDSTERSGRLVFVDNLVDPANGTVLLKAEFPNADGRLWPGAYVEARLELSMKRGAIVIPAPALNTGQKGTYVYVMNADSTAAVRAVQVVRSDDEFAVIGSGLARGETVITDGQFRLAPGGRVVVRNPRADARR